MLKTIALIMITLGGLTAVRGAASAQEVNSDVKIPTPSEVVTPVRAVAGLLSTPGVAEGPERLVSSGAAADGVVGTLVVGTLNEAVARAELGDFMTSLLIKAGVIRVETPSIRVARPGDGSQEGSRPAWTGRTPMALSLSRTERSRAIGRR